MASVLSFISEPASNGGVKMSKGGILRAYNQFLTQDLVNRRKVHSLIVKLGLSSYLTVANSLLNMYAKSGDPVTAEIVFDRMRLKSTSSWNAMISLHMQSGRLDLALTQFEQMSERDIVSWNSMISGYNQRGFDLEALNMFSKMLKDLSLRPDRYTLASVLSACANMEDLNLGKQIHAHIVRTEFDTSGPVGNALISMYSKSGDVERARKILAHSVTSDLSVIAFTALLDGYIKLGDLNPAREIFDSLKDRDVVAWTAMIVGYVQNGFNYDAADLFRIMNLKRQLVEFYKHSNASQGLVKHMECYGDVVVSRVVPCTRLAQRPRALASSSSLVPMRPSSTAPARPTAVPVHAKSQP
ncbi:hypothetical protein RJ639_046198 [Escallonia herrerae]|uniref:Pentatricopeptide repeat-containing protein n=1 Tax=Escallonia herrerae TaxID=1293975 RepID=A0AA88W9X1_9ASTE|nr:hypothetical protein RJ639_046198 [Escallonia herrerae]